MDEKTADLRDLFVDATGSETVTEGQSADRGSLLERDDATVGERLTELIATMRDRYGFSTSLPDAAYERVVRGHFDDEPDAVIAAAIGDDESIEIGKNAAADVDATGVFRARTDLHLVTDADRETPVAYDEVKRLVLAGATDEELAAALSSDPETVRRYRRVAEADVASMRANHRFRDEFRDLLTDADIEGSLAAGAREDGLREAAEDIETDVSF
ncbi:hypothetical protein SAMN05192561_101324 [Halopenitus malekzadehii]|uniref:Conditioned medium-induced protein 4 n=1 Tax=Halopenitus malekzadehii TaxID=1267564 RepID=A0A1H6HVJ3_9EURY|nr:hypothetical protein [Halopenitus malekzadehii]SEH38141.1 hypothetical protein SAMN05192561_101324 [Halopenitus malekzadehii]